MDYNIKLINLTVFQLLQFENLSPCNEGLHFLTERKKMQEDIEVKENPKACFDNALSKNLFDRFEMLYYMYMYSKNGRDYFKHQNTRDYISCSESDPSYKWLDKYS